MPKKRGGECKLGIDGECWGMVESNAEKRVVECDVKCQRA